MVETRAARATEEAAASSLRRLPQEVLLHILSCVEGREDLRVFFLAICSDRSMVAVAKDPCLAALGLRKRDQLTAWEIAAWEGRGDVIVHMLRMGSNGTSRFVGTIFTPLEWAASHGLPQVVQHLWAIQDVQADVESAVRALHEAATDGHAECLRLLLAHPTPLHADSRPSDWTWSALQEAAKDAHVEAVQVLLEHGASLSYLDGVEKTALHCACIGDGIESNRCEIIRMLLRAQHGTSVIDACDEKGRTPLAWAASKGLAGCCEVLLRAGSQAVNVRNRAGQTPYQMARRNPRVRELLLQYGAEPIDI